MIVTVSSESFPGLRNYFPLMTRVASNALSALTLHHYLCSTAINVMRFVFFNLIPAPAIRISGPIWIPGRARGRERLS